MADAGLCSEEARCHTESGELTGGALGGTSVLVVVVRSISPAEPPASSGVYTVLGPNTRLLTGPNVTPKTPSPLEIREGESSSMGGGGAF